MREINLNGAGPEPTVVTLFGKTYRLRQVTRSVQKEVESAQARLDAMQREDEADSDKVVEGLAEALGALLAIEGQHKTPAKKVLLEKWKADELTLNQLTQYFEQLQEAAVERPT